MINITIDNILFEVWGDKTLWSPPRGLNTVDLPSGTFVEAPGDWARLARALVLCDYEDRNGHTFVANCELYEHFIDTHDDQGNKVPEGRPSGIHFALKSGMPPVRATKVLTGRMDGKPIASVFEWDDPLNAVMTTREAEQKFGLKEGSVKKAAQRRDVPARKSGGTWLIRAFDAMQRWA